MGSFILTSLLGTFLLALPQASRQEPLSLIEALFTAVSAVCVTGLVVVDTGSRFTPFGQAVILSLIQAGGLGIMSFSVIFLTALGRRLSFRNRFALRQSLAPTFSGEVGRLVRSVFIYTFVIEALGALLLFIYWRASFPFPMSLWYAIFHSVSAFSNAGFSFFSTSFVSYRGDIYFNLVITSLVLAGGIGFVVLVDIKDFAVSRLLRQRAKRLSFHSKVVLSTTALLILVALVGFFLLEVNNSLAGLPVKEKILAAYFQAVTPRTAGFNTVSFSSVSPATLFFTIMLMFVGASPGSTGGGIKTSTTAIIVAAAFNWFRGRPTVHMFHRTVPPEIVNRAMSIAAANLVLVSLITFVLVVVELGGVALGQGERGFIQFFFEAASGLGTVGLSTGITTGLSGLGKLVLVATMLVGRVGPLTIAIALATRESRAALIYAEERIMVG